jgi:hypothetical protein
VFLPPGGREVLLFRADGRRMCVDARRERAVSLAYASGFQDRRYEVF